MDREESVGRKRCGSDRANKNASGVDSTDSRSKYTQSGNRKRLFDHHTANFHPLEITGRGHRTLTVSAAQGWRSSRTSYPHIAA